MTLTLSPPPASRTSASWARHARRRTWSDWQSRQLGLNFVYWGGAQLLVVATVSLLLFGARALWPLGLYGAWAVQLMGASPAAIVATMLAGVGWLAVGIGYGLCAAAHGEQGRVPWVALAVHAGGLLFPVLIGAGGLLFVWWLRRRARERTRTEAGRWASRALVAQGAAIVATLALGGAPLARLMRAEALSGADAALLTACGLAWSAGGLVVLAAVRAARAVDRTP